jgi:hypothetical protein
MSLISLTGALRRSERRMAVPCMIKLERPVGREAEFRKALDSYISEYERHSEAQLEPAGFIRVLFLYSGCGVEKPAHAALRR